MTNHLKDQPQGDHPDGRPDKDKTVDVVVNTKEVAVQADTTGRGIKEAAGLDLAWRLFKIQGDHEIPVSDDEQIRVHKNERFVCTPTLDPS